jgi:predicted Zn-dependent peptidase
MKELNDIRGGRPVTQKELDYNKQSLIRRYPSGFETVGQISNQLANLVTYGLPDSYFNDYISKVNAVTIEDVDRVAKKYLDPSKMANRHRRRQESDRTRLEGARLLDHRSMDTEGKARPRVGTDHLVI